MKRVGENSLLDTHLKEKLKALDPSAPLAEWGELEILLSAEHKPVSININRKQLVIAALIISATLGIWGIVSMVNYFITSSDNSTNVSDTLQTSNLNAIEPEQKAVIAPVIPAVDTSRLDSTELLEKKTDSVLKAADSFLKKIIQEQQTKPVEAAIQPADKKKKQKKSKDVPVDSSAVTMPVEQLPSPDTSHHKAIEQRPVPPSDSAAAPKNGKSKKGKNKKSTPPAPAPPPAKPDSLK